ncbi:MAG: gluconate 2-dehydrogenase subunit 3 family protein [Balneolaceae bacterium]|nr:gluconate 2-dehydrogenase subunit 3 family protein [Balneolaceae bacterium]
MEDKPREERHHSRGNSSTNARRSGASGGRGGADRTSGAGGSTFTRREALKTLTLASFATVGLTMTGCQNSPENPANNPFGEGVSPEDLEMWNRSFFTEHEFETVRQLTNMIIPADERSGNAEEAGVPEFIDFMMLDRPGNQTPIRGGLNWLDAQCRKQFGGNFVDCTEEQKHAMLEQIAWPEDAEPGMEPGVRFFNRMRDLTASGFWSSETGIDDIGYIGNMATSWDGCSDEACEHVGVSYEES